MRTASNMNDDLHTMAQPVPEPVDPSRVREYAQAIVTADKFPVLATVEGGVQARVRPVSPVRTDGFTVYVANLRHYGKTAEITVNPRVELCYVNERHDQVRLTGVAEVVADRALLQDIWNENPLLKHYLGTIDNPDLIIYRIRPVHVRFMREWALEYFDVPLT